MPFILCRCHSRESLEVLAEKAVVGKVQAVDDALYGQVAVSQHHFDVSDGSTVNPFFGGHITHFVDNRSQIALRKIHAVGIVG